MNIITVIPLSKTIFKEELTYFSMKLIQPGSIVVVSIRNKKTLALVVNTEPLSGIKSNIKDMDFNLKKIIEIKERSIFSDDFLTSVFKTSKYFATNKSMGISSLIPSIFKEEYDKISKIKNSDQNIVNINKKIKTEKLLFQMNLTDRISIYKTMIRAHFAEKKSIFMVLPNELEIENFYNNLSKGIENFSYKIHSSMKKKDILENYRQIVTEEHPVLILATASYLSVPRNDISTIILENEHSNSYRMLSKPHIDLRTFTEIFASNIGAKLILSDTLLRYETIERKQNENFGEVYPLSFRLNFEGEINIIGPELVEKKGGKFRIFKNQTLSSIQEYLENNKNVFIFALRRGLATQTICKDCNDILLCETCGAPVVLYNSKNGTKKMFVCNRCKKEIDSNTPCRLCGSWNMLPLGIGTDTVEEELNNIFNKKNVKIFKLDKESAKNKKEAEQIINDFENEKGAILVGTEIALFYIKKGIPLSIVASFDSLWSIPNYKMGERILEIILAILEKTKGKFIIQTKNNNDGAILGVNNNNLAPFVREELEDRKNLNYPPYMRFIKVSYTGEKKEINEVKKYLEETFKLYEPEIFAGFIAKVKDKYNINMLITLKPENWSILELSGTGSIDEKLFNLLTSLPPSFNIYVDPENIL